MADISKVEAEVQKDEEIIDVPIYQKNGDPYLGADGKPSTIGVLGSESKRYQRHRDEITQRLLRGRVGKMSPKDLHQNRIAQAAAAVVRWSGWESGGKEWRCDPENVKALLATGNHILEQVEDGIQRHADFFAHSSPS